MLGVGLSDLFPIGLKTFTFASISSVLRNAAAGVLEADEDWRSERVLVVVMKRSTNELASARGVPLRSSTFWKLENDESAMRTM